jgi:hypothetical protein
VNTHVTPHVHGQRRVVDARVNLNPWQARATPACRVVWRVWRGGGVYLQRSQSPCGYVASCQRSINYELESLGPPSHQQHVSNPRPVTVSPRRSTAVRAGRLTTQRALVSRSPPVPQPETFQCPQVTTLAIQSTMVHVIRRWSPHSSTQHTSRGLVDVELNGEEVELICFQARPRSVPASVTHSAGKTPRLSALSPSSGCNEQHSS